MSEGKHTPEPGPWEVRSWLSHQLTPGWYVCRKVTLCDYEWMLNAAGRRKKFKSEAAARAAIAAATGEQA